MTMRNQRDQGRYKLLRHIEQFGPIARIDLSEKTGISRASVTTMTAQLLREGLIEEIPRDDQTADSKRGRPRVDLRISGVAHLVAGLRIFNNSMSLLLIDFQGHELTELDMPIPKGALPPQEIVAVIENGLTQLLAPLGKSIQELSGIGIGLAGVVDAQNGGIYWSPSLSEKNINLREILEDKLEVPVFIDNDANLVAIAEKRFGYGRDHSDFIVVTIESGVGIGIYLNDQIYRGTRGCGAEFGHTKVQLQGALCRCGQRGCLEAYVADYALVREATSIGFLKADELNDDSLSQLLNAAKDDDPTARTILNRAGSMFAIGLANLVNIFDPQLIILAGEQMQFDHLYTRDVIEEMRKSIVQIDKAPPEVLVHHWSNMMWARGAAAFALDFVYEIAARETDQDEE